MTRSATPARAWLGGTMLLVAGALSSCTSDEPGRQAETAVAPSTTSSPFTVDAPQGFEVVDAGVGTEAPDWGLDCCGTQEPFTVLSPDGSMSGPGVVVVSTTGFGEYQGQLDQAGAGYFDEITRPSRSTATRPASRLACPATVPARSGRPIWSSPSTRTWRCG